MSITDDLREYAGKAIERPDYMGGLTFDLRRIADRIDAALEEGYIELPKDADGVPIRIGDKMLLLNGRTAEVYAIGVGLFMVWNPEDRHFDAYLANACHHAQPDSWERIIEDAQADGVRYHNDGKPSDFDALVERCKRLAGEGA